MRFHVTHLQKENMVLLRQLRHESFCYDSAPYTIQLALAEKETAVQRREELASQREAAVGQREAALGQWQVTLERREAGLEGQEEALRRGQQILQVRQWGVACMAAGVGSA